MTIQISEKDFLDLVHWARRYANGRMTGVPDSFNRIYDMLSVNHPELMEKEQTDAHVCPNWPHAKDGMEWQ